MSASQLTAELSDALVPAILTVANGTTGLAPLVAVRDPGLAGSYLDFADNTFKTAGWTTRQATMAEVSAPNSPGRYELGLAVASWSGRTAGSNHVGLEYSVTVSGVPRFETDRILLVNHAYDVAVSTDILSDATPFPGGSITEARLAELAAANLPADVDTIVGRLPAALVGGRIDADVGAMQANVLTGAALATDAVSKISADVDLVLSGQHGAGSWLGIVSAQLDVRQGWSRSINPISEMRAIVHLEQNGDRVALPGGAALSYQAYDRTGTAIPGFSGSGTLRNQAGDAFFEIVDPYTPTVGEIIVIRCTITGSGVGTGTHVGQTEVAFPAF